MKTQNRENKTMDEVNESEYKKTLKEEKAVTGSVTPELKVVESGKTDGQGNFVAYGLDGKIPTDRKEEVADWGHTYKTFENDTTVID